jgi:hypothetical protein
MPGSARGIREVVREVVRRPTERPLAESSASGPLLNNGPRGPILFTLYCGADFSLQRASARSPEQRETGRQAD